MYELSETHANAPKSKNSDGPVGEVVGFRVESTGLPGEVSQRSLSNGELAKAGDDKIKCRCCRRVIDGARGIGEIDSFPYLSSLHRTFTVHPPLAIQA